LYPLRGRDAYNAKLTLKEPRKEKRKRGDNEGKKNKKLLKKGLIDATLPSHMKTKSRVH